MANKGRFIDRTPLICAAGLSTGTSRETVANNLKQYGIDDATDGLRRQANIREDDVNVVNREPQNQNASSLGNNAQIKEPVPDLLVKTRYEQQTDDVKETVPVRAHFIDNTFGGSSYEEYTPKKQVQSKTPYKVIWHSKAGHKNYIKTHDDYNPSEDINRKHGNPYNTTHWFGMKSGIDSRGIWVRCWCDWHQKEPLVSSSKIQANHLERTRPVLGKAMTPNHIEDMFPKDHTFGVRSDGTELSKDHMRYACVFERNFLEWLSSLNNFKILMKEQSQRTFNFEDFYEKCLFWDKEQTGCLPTKVFYEQCVCEDLTHLKENLESLLKILSIIVDDKIDFKGFIDIMKSDNAIEIMPFEDIPPEHQQFVSSTDTAYCDYLIINNADMPTAGLPTYPHDISRPFDPQESYKSDVDHLKDTTTSSVLSPSIFPHCGPTHRNFFEPRDADTMRELFEKVGYNFPGDTFWKLWKKGVEKDNNTGFVCVDTFKTLVKIACRHPRCKWTNEEDLKLQLFTNYCYNLQLTS